MKPDVVDKTCRKIQCKYGDRQYQSALPLPISKGQRIRPRCHRDAGRKAVCNYHALPSVAYDEPVPGCVRQSSLTGLAHAELKRHSKWNLRC